MTDQLEPDDEELADAAEAEDGMSDDDRPDEPVLDPVPEDWS